MISRLISDILKQDEQALASSQLIRLLNIVMPNSIDFSIMQQHDDSQGLGESLILKFYSKLVLEAVSRID